MENLIETFVSSKAIFNGKIIKVHCDTVRLPNKKEATREVVDHPGAIAVVPVLDDGRIVMVRQYRYPVDQVTLEIPAGKLDLNEDPLDCVVRELREETGYEAQKIEKLTSIYTAPGFSNEMIHIYIAKGLTMKEACPDEDEFINVEIYKPEVIKSMLRSGTIRDAKTLVGILLAGL